MGNIITYMKWRGDLTFAEREFGDADNLVLSELVYLDLDGIVPSVEDGGSITLQDAAEQFLSRSREAKCAGLPAKELICAMADSRRFGNVRLSHFSEVFDTKTNTDFCAMHISLDGKQCYVAFRGTSDSLLGWREDFSMSFHLMPSQRLAAEYLDGTMDDEAEYFVGGHSKGGNLAVYAAMKLPDEKLARVKRVYSNDGPGLCPDIVDMERYADVAEKLTRIVPEFSVIGALFEAEPPTMIVRSNAESFNQHDGMSWLLEGDRFCTVSKRSATAEYYNHIFDEWIESASIGQRESFTNDLFDALEAGGAKKRTDIAAGGFEEFETVLLSIVQSDSKTKVVIGKLIGTFFAAFRSAQFSRFLRRKETLQGLVLFVLGLFLTAAPEFAARCIGGCMGIAAIVALGKKQLKYASIGTASRPLNAAKMICNIFLICVIMYLIAQRNILLHFSNLLMGGCFLYLAYRWAKSVTRGTMQRKTRLIHAGFMTVSFVLGLVPVITAGLVLWQYVFSAGCFVLLYGTGKLLHGLYEEGRQGMNAAVVSDD